MNFFNNPAIYINEHFSSDDEDTIYVRYPNNEEIPLSNVEISSHILKLQDDNEDESELTSSSMKGNIQRNENNENQLQNKDQSQNHDNTLNTKTMRTGIISTSHQMNFYDQSRHNQLDANLINERRQRSLLKANIRKLTRLTLLKESQSKRAIVRKIKAYIRLFRLRFRKFFNYFQPLKIFVHKTEKKFGTGIASFFDLWISIIYLNLAIFIVTLLFNIIPWFFSEKAKNFNDFWNWRLLLGFIGVDSGSIGHTFFFYGGYIHSIARQWDTAFGYIVGVLAYIGVSLFIVVLAIGSRLSKVTNTDPNVKYSTAILSLWDHQVVSKQSVEALQRSISSRLKEYLKEDELKSSGKRHRSKKQILAHILRRFFGYTFSLVLLIAAPALVFLITQFYGEINTAIPFMTSVLIAFLSFVFPQLLKLCVKIERYENATYATLHNVIRTFIVKLVIATALVIRVLYPEILKSFNIDYTGSAPKGSNKCLGTEAGMVFWQLIIIDFFSSALTNILPNIFMVQAKAIVGIQDKKLEFGVADSVNQLLYRQALIWIGTALCPMLPLLGMISNILLFFIKYIVCRWTIKFPKNPMANAKSNAFNQFMLLLTLILSLIPIIAFLLKGDHDCGPFENLGGADTIVSDFLRNYHYFKDNGAWKIFNSAIRSTLILYIIIIVCLILLFFIVQKLRMYRSRWILELQRVELEKKEKQDIQKANFKSSS